MKNEVTEEDISDMLDYDGYERRPELESKREVYFDGGVLKFDEGLMLL